MSKMRRKNFAPNDSYARVRMPKRDRLSARDFPIDTTSENAARAARFLKEHYDLDMAASASARYNFSVLHRLPIGAMITGI